MRKRLLITFLAAIAIAVVATDGLAVSYCVPPTVIPKGLPNEDPPTVCEPKRCDKCYKSPCHVKQGVPSSTSPLQREVFRLALVLLYTAGLRRGELTRLTLADYDSAERTLTIRASKFHKSRLVPLSADAGREVDAYLVARRRFPHAAEAPLLYRRRQGLRPYTGAGLAQGLRQLFRRADVRTATGGLPRVHDLRHSFTHQALLRWYRSGIDVQTKLPALAMYMGHVSIVSTQYYLSFFEPFAETVSERFALHCAPFVSGGDGL